MNIAIITAGKDLFFFPRQTVVQDPYNVIQRLLNTLKLKKLQTKRRVQREVRYLLGQVMVLDLKPNI